MADYPNKHFWHHLSNTKLLRSSLTFLALFSCGCAIVFLINYFYSAITIFTIAATLAALLNYPVQWLNRFIPRGLAIAIVCLLFVTIIATLITSLGFEIITQGQGLSNSLFDFIKSNDFKPVTKFLPISKFLESIQLSKFIQTLQTGLLTGIGFLQGVFSNFLTAVFIAVICVYMLIDGEKIWLFSLKLLPLELRDRFGLTFQKSFLGFFRAQILLVFFLSASCWVFFTAIGVKYALFLCLILGIIDAIPGIGGTLCAIVVTLLVLVSQGFWMAVKVLITCTVLQQIQDNFIAPKLMKANLEINPVLLFLALFLGERVAGILGMFLAVPIAAMIVSWMKEPIKSESIEPLADEPKSNKINHN
ncbi:AI-2E family transporter [Phormidium sp. LEGE 05292]|uniref:AI-2E family transporter n=1 Tax=[Phormidium] sp. LEGE 05292 TaxID=767427 RepID=UPI00187F8E53|nr:AI-2E family transporter [Phormidium sp. LEGE 05292]MBE9227588.1 AI-2E family transporter [Phormidium sp. LEGE 05292]